MVEHHDNQNMSPNRISRFSTAANHAADHLQFAQRLYHQRVPVQQTIPALRHGFHCVEQALQHLAGQQMSNEASVEADADLSAVTRLSTDQFGRLEELYRQYRNENNVMLSRREALRYIHALHRAVRPLRIWDTENNRDQSLSKRMRSITHLPVLFLTLLGLLAMGWVIVQEMPPKETGLRGTYYADTTFSEALFERIDETINFKWGKSAPKPLMKADQFSVIWEGTVIIKGDEKRIFSIGADDGVRLFIDNKLVIDNSGQHAFKPKRSNKPIKGAGEHAIRIEYVEHTGAARVNLTWSTPNGYWEDVPTHRLRPAPLHSPDSPMFSAASPKPGPPRPPRTIPPRASRGPQKAPVKSPGSPAKPHQPRPNPPQSAPQNTP